MLLVPILVKYPVPSAKGMDSIVHFEIPADNPKRASKFYNDAFGWNIQQWESMPYWIVVTTESDQMGTPKSPGAINGGMGQREGPLKSIVVTIKVDDIDKALQKIEKGGGKTVQKKQPIGDMGFTAYFKDSEGNVVGLWAPAGKM
jgi:predicted enzyme related to lactoylglutathione lyase